MKQGEIWQLGLDPAVGAEMKKTRPGLVINVESEIIAQVQEAVNQVIGA